MTASASLLAFSAVLLLPKNQTKVCSSERSHPSNSPLGILFESSRLSDLLWAPGEHLSCLRVQLKCPGESKTVGVGKFGPHIFKERKRELVKNPNLSHPQHTHGPTSPRKVCVLVLLSKFSEGRLDTENEISDSFNPNYYFSGSGRT
ncbi:hypothetical protein PABG_11709 [Paracoccidioides brasiliensis Pb03]|nr:hypothetical protein PABG_11709 [Paracoccidioides brasiliensis Pb03]